MFKTFKKYTYLLFAFMILSLSSAQAGSLEISKYISQTGFEHKSTVSVYVVDNNNGDVIYKRNEKKLLNPASILKVLTYGAAYKTLGSDYKFETAFYKDGANNLYLKLSGDSMLTSNDLVNLLNKLKINVDISKVNFIYIDDSIFDKAPYPSGWMEEDAWPNMRAITPYIIDSNMVQIAIQRSSLATTIDIIQNDPYKLSIINELKLGDSQEYKIQKMYGENSNIIGFSGVISQDEQLYLPVLNPEINFNIKLREAMNKVKIEYPGKIHVKKTPIGAVKVASISRPIQDISQGILLNSDNFMAEVTFKAAAAKYINYEHPATFDDSINMFYSIFPASNYEGVKIVDGSGVSRYNLVSARYVVDCMRELFKDENFKNLLATANQGTLKDRMIFLENNLRAKTGTLANMSSIAGALTSKSGKNLDFAIIVQNSPKRKAILKNFENNIITILYRKF